MSLRLLVVIIALSFAVYRIWAFRKRGIPIAIALGFGLDRRPFIHLGVGTLISAAAMSAIFFVEWSSGLLSVSHVNSMTALIRDLSSYVAVPLIEEFMFRCAVLGGLLVLIPRPFLAVVLSAALFGGVHAQNPNASILSVLGTMIGGLSYGFAYLEAERIWFPLGLHFGWNYFQARMFGFSISGGRVRGPAPFMFQHDIGPALLTGGAYGPEGGLIGFGARLFVVASVTAWLISERRRQHRSMGSQQPIQS